MKTVTVCIGSSCHLKGSHDVVLALQTLIKEHKLDDIATVKASFCHGECAKGVSVKVNDSSVISVNKENVISFFIEYILNDKQ